MKKVVVFIIVSSFFCSNMHAQKFDCSQFKNGKFKIEDTPGIAPLIIERNGNEQTEINEVDGVKLLFYVTWTGDCIYTLQLKKIIRNDNHIVFDPELIITVTITDVHKNGYSQTSTSNKFDAVYKSEVIKIE